MRMKGQVNVKALELQLDPTVSVQVTAVVIHTRAGLVETSRLLSSGNGTICPRMPAQAPGSRTHLLMQGF